MGISQTCLNINSDMLDSSVGQSFKEVLIINYYANANFVKI